MGWTDPKPVVLTASYEFLRPRTKKAECVFLGWEVAVAKPHLVHAFSLVLPWTVPPSKPDCGIEGETVIGNNIQLTCQSEEGSPAPQYSWKSYDIQNKERPTPPGNREDRRPPDTPKCR